MLCRGFFVCLKSGASLGQIFKLKMPLSYLRGILERCLAVLKWSILIGIITLKHALQCAIRHISQLLIRVIPKKCCQMLSRGFLPHFRQHNRLILWRLTKIIIIFFVRPKDFFSYLDYSEILLKERIQLLYYSLLSVSS